MVTKILSKSANKYYNTKNYTKNRKLLSKS
jgi:hypothetical protein